MGSPLSGIRWCQRLPIPSDSVEFSPSALIFFFSFGQYQELLVSVCHSEEPERRDGGILTAPISYAYFYSGFPKYETSKEQIARVGFFFSFPFFFLKYKHGEKSQVSISPQIYILLSVTADA